MTTTTKKAPAKKKAPVKKKATTKAKPKAASATAAKRKTATTAAKRKTTSTTKRKTTTTAAKRKKATLTVPYATRLAAKKYPYKKVELRHEWEKAGYGIEKKVSTAADKVRRGVKGAGSVLRKTSVAAKKKRMAKGALAGTPRPRTRKVGAAKRDPNFELSPAQKRTLSPAMQKGLLRYHRGR